jgi:Protein of unknown function (DUF664)
MRAMPDTMVAATREVLAESLDEIRKGVADLSVQELNARPGGPTTNPVAVIAVHALASTRSWLSLAVGAQLPPRDRPSEFRTVAGEGFAVTIDGSIEECLALLGPEVTFDPAREGVPTWQAGGGANEPVTAAWALGHALAHLGEHVGHLHMTRELLRPTSAS